MVFVYKSKAGIKSIQFRIICSKYFQLRII
nr:MAG TPA: hypothetical protein [Caudoviricetes sp.]